MPDENTPPPEPPEPPEPPLPEQPTLLGSVAPDEMFARGMQTAKMSGAAGGWQPPSIEECARLFPGYEVLQLLGRGGMGAVYQARQIELDRLVAIKLLPLEISVDKDFADRFRREARAMARLEHPNIIAVHDFGTTSEGHLYFVMAYVDGANLADIIHRVGLTGEQALAIVEQVCTALAYAHSKGIVHRDMKPANVMIDTESQVKVADFGLARLTDPSAEQMGRTMTGTVMGTPDYMAPEQMKGMNVDHRADIYSLGVMVYEMFCKEVPRGAFEPPSVRGGCDPRIDPIVIKAMQPNPDRRYQTTPEMKVDVVAARTPLPVVVGRVSPRATAGGDTGPTPPIRLPKKSAAPGTHQPPGQGEGPAGPTEKQAALAPPAKAAKKRRSAAPLALGGLALLAAIAALVHFAPWKKDTTAGGARAVLPQTSPDPAEEDVVPGVNEPGGAASPRPVTTSASAAPLAPVQVASSTSPADPEVAAFPPGKWVKDVTDLSKLPSLAEFKDGWARGKDDAPDYVVKVDQATVLQLRNGGIRVRRKFPPNWNGNQLVTIRNNGGNMKSRIFEFHYYSPGSRANHDPLQGVIQIRELRPDLEPPNPTEAQRWAAHVLIAEKKIPPASTELTAEFVAVGKTLVGRINGETLTCTVEDGNRTGLLTVFGVDKSPFRDVEILNLDGLSEAEALKAAGIDAGGKESSGATVAAAPAWQKIEFAKVDLAATTLNNPHAQMEGPLLHLSEYATWTLHTTPMRNLAVRTTVVFDANTEHFDPRLCTRTTNGGDYLFALLYPHNAEIRLRDTKKKEDVALRSLAAHRVLKNGEDVTFQFACVGSRLAVWADGALLGSMDGAPLDNAAQPFIQASDCRFRSFEYFNLDGLSQAEALKLLGLPDSSTSATPVKPNPTSAHLSPSTEPWQDVLHDPAKLSVSKKGVERIPEGLRLTDKGSAMLRPGQGPERDGSVRMLATFGGIRPQLMARSKNNGGNYQVYVNGKAAIKLARWDVSDQKITSLRDFPLPQPLELGQDYELELRVVGQTLAVKYNGEVLGTVTDATLAEGQMGVQVVVNGIVPVMIKALEVLDLDAQGGAAPPAPPPSASYPQPPQWIDATAALRSEQLATGNLAVDGDWLKINANVAATFPVRSNVSLRNPILRVLFSGGVDLAVRRGRKEDQDIFYHANISPGRAIIAIAHTTPALVAEKLDSPDGYDGEHEAVFAAQGDTLTLWVDGKVVVTAHDSTLTEGSLAVGFYKGGALEHGRIKKVEYGELPDATPAGAQLSPAAEPWQDVLRDPAKLGLTGKVEQTPEGLRFTEKGSAMLRPGQGPEHDGAVRMRATFDGTHRTLRARATGAGAYQLFAGEKGINLGRWDGAAKHNTTLREFSLRAPLQPGQDYELELRVVGQTITAKLNGEVLGSVTDATLAEGSLGVQVFEPGAAPTVVKALEVLDLGVTK